MLFSVPKMQYLPADMQADIYARMVQRASREKHAPPPTASATSRSSNPPPRKDLRPYSNVSLDGELAEIAEHWETESKVKAGESQPPPFPRGRGG
ncbi:hypothetical protein GS421_07490 [Rhodococcus hoagii]|nr:hypothetical protein [Prescottella equi]